MQVKNKYLKKFNLCFVRRKKNLKKKWKCLILLFFIFIILFKNKYHSNEPISVPVPVPVSVIILCYNSEIYLKNLFSMFKAQTMKNYELIFIDDGSKDNTTSLINNQKAKDKRIKLITLEKNTGAGNARNVGLKSAIGEYVIFLDSDDIFYPNLLKTSYEIASKYDIDILVFDFECIHKNNLSCQYYRNQLFKYPFPINEIFSPEDISDYIFTFSRGVPWNKLFKRDFIIKNNLRFLNLKRHNDSFFIYTAYVMAKKIYMINEVLLRYRWGNKKSITSTYNKFGKECVQKNLKELKNFLLDKTLYNIYKKSFQEISIHF